jgi:two-component system C4-dicarboxylate transport sensor histidine kinase DctB
MAAPGRGPSLAAGHERFGRAALSIYLGTAAVAAALLVTALVTDLTDQQQAERQRLSLDTQLRAQYLARHLQLLAGELTRLGLRSEVNLLDANPDPERDLLRLTHEKSAFFDVGVAILDDRGAVVWAEPQTFLSAGASLEEAPIFASVKQSRTVQVVPGSRAGRPGSVVYLASPIERGGRFQGALVGAVDVASGRTLEPESRAPGAVLVLATREGDVAYPSPPPPSALDPAWRGLVRSAGLAFPARGALVTEQSLAGRSTVVAAAPVQSTDFVLLQSVDAARFFAPARHRLLYRLAAGLGLFAVPFFLLSRRLRASLSAFRDAEADAVREEHLKSLGQAVNLIAHEVKNSLSGIRVALDLVLLGDRKGPETRQRAVDGLRTEVERLSDFATELLSFAKGVTPHPIPFDLAEFVPKVAELSRSTAESRKIQLDVTVPAETVPVRADPSLVHVVLGNLLGNALDFAGGGAGEPGRVAVHVGRAGAMARIAVADNGPGVSPSVRPRLFEPFVAGRPSGVGIGLALSRAIARAHGGDLALDAAPSGTVFVLTLPRELP